MGKGGGGGNSPFPDPPIIINITDDRRLSLYGNPNTLTRQISRRDGSTMMDRHYGSDGRAFRDIDYTNHGNPATHPIVPHQHKFDWSQSIEKIRDPIGKPLDYLKIYFYMYNSKFFKEVGI